MSSCIVNITAPVGQGAFLVAIEGVVTAGAELMKYFAGLSGTVVIDLHGVTRITSPGVREWLSGLAAMPAEELGFVRCVPAMMRQFNMIRKFGGNGQLISFYAPYFCEACSHSFDHLIDLRTTRVSATEPAPVYCQRCNGEAELDELPSYLDYAAHQPHPLLSPLAQLLADSFGPPPQERLRITKEIERETTILRIYGLVKHGSNLAPWFDGATGTVRIDLSGVSLLTDDGARALLSSIPAGGECQPVFERVPLSACETLVHASPSSAPEILSLIVEGQCEGCQMRMEIPVRADSPTAELDCPQCGAARAIVLDRSGHRAAHDYLARNGSPAAPSIPAGAPSPAPRDSIPAAEGEAPGGGEFVAVSPTFQRVLQTAADVAATDASVLLRGETGTGKEFIARRIHAMSPRREEPFVAVNCAALSEGVLESELFGHEAGSFTGATSRSLGRFERAHGGTLFIDEVGDLPASVQVKLLRTLQERVIERVGGSESIPVDIRLIAATHRDLEAMIRAGEFREDLYYRLNVVPLVVPPLRERREDILPLAHFYLERLQKAANRSGLRLSAQLQRRLVEYSWPGNVRQLINVMERAVALTPSNQEASCAALEYEPGQPTVSAPTERPRRLKDAVEDYERELIAQALAEASGNRTAAARRLGISRQALAHKLTKYGL